jgi:hypothetical protein
MLAEFDHAVYEQERLILRFSGLTPPERMTNIITARPPAPTKLIKAK